MPDLDLVVRKLLSVGCINAGSRPCLPMKAGSVPTLLNVGAAHKGWTITDQEMPFVQVSNFEDNLPHLLAGYMIIMHLCHLRAC